MDREATDGAVDQNPPSAAAASGEHKFVIAEPADGSRDETSSPAGSRWSTRVRGALGAHWLETVLVSVGSAVLAGLRESRAEGGSHYAVDDGILKHSDFVHGHYVLLTKEPIPRDIWVDKPEETVWLTKK